MGTSLCPDSGAASPHHTPQLHGQGGNKCGGGLGDRENHPMHMRVVWGCGRWLDPEPLFGQKRNGGKGLLPIKAKAAAARVRLPAGDTLGDSGEFTAAGLCFQQVKQGQRYSQFSALYIETSALQKKQCLTQYSMPILLVIISF